MDFLVDQAISWQVARGLGAAGHNAVHVRDIGLAAAEDEIVLKRAADERRVIITQDIDFGTLLVKAGERRPSVVLLRLRDGRPEAHVRALLKNLGTVEQDLSEGAIVVLTDTMIRVRKLT